MKLTKKSLARKLDKEISRIVRSRGICARCSKGAEEKTMQCAHIFHRRHFSVRWDLKNCLCLCGGCHIFWAHLEPILFTEFVKKYLGSYEYAQLKLRARQIKQWTIPEMIELLEELKKL